MKYLAPSIILCMWEYRVGWSRPFKVEIMAGETDGRSMFAWSCVRCREGENGGVRMFPTMVLGGLMCSEDMTKRTRKASQWSVRVSSLFIRGLRFDSCMISALWKGTGDLFTSTKIKGVSATVKVWYIPKNQFDSMRIGMIYRVL